MGAPPSGPPPGRGPPRGPVCGGARVCAARETPSVIIAAIVQPPHASPSSPSRSPPLVVRGPGCVCSRQGGHHQVRLRVLQLEARSLRA
jgi:hypothetical protein